MSGVMSGYCCEDVNDLLILPRHLTLSPLSVARSWAPAGGAQGLTGVGF